MSVNREYRKDGTWFNTNVRPSRKTATRKFKREAVKARKAEKK